jgi:beta-phosphoglucomutase-like phosphatase (HAD superfamily)
MRGGIGASMLHGMQTAHPPRGAWPGWHGRHDLPAGLRVGVAACGLVAVVALVAAPAAGLLAAVGCGVAAALVWPMPASVALTTAPARSTEAPARPRRTGPHGLDLATLAGRSWLALETAQAALQAAEAYVGADEISERSHRLVEERARTIEQLRGLANDEHADAPILHWLATPHISRGMLGLPIGVTACMFDLDSVLTTSASMHVASWAETFDPFLLERSERGHRPYIPFHADRDYEAHLAGRPRLDGIRAFVTSRGIGLPEGSEDDPAGAPTVHGLARRKNEILQKRLAEQGVDAFVGSRCYLEAARVLGVHRAVVSASANTPEILERAQLDHLIERRIDGTTIAAEGLAPKPAPDTLLAACRALDVHPSDSVDFETTLAGISAARAGGFRFAVGVDRDGDSVALRASDSDVVVTDLVDLVCEPVMA